MLHFFNIGGRPDHSSNHAPKSMIARLGTQPQNHTFPTTNPTKKNKQNITKPNPLTNFSISLTSNILYHNFNPVSNPHAIRMRVLSFVSSAPSNLI